MGKVILDAATRADLPGVLHKATGRTEVYAEDGSLLGVFTPVYDLLGPIELPGPDPTSDEQIAEVLKTPDPGRPLADILRDLRGR